MASKYWVKLYHEILDDPKMGRLSDRHWRRVIELFLLAGDLDQGGYLPPMEDMAWRLRATPAELVEDFKALEKVGIVCLKDDRPFVTKFAERQAPVDAAERGRRYRERERKAAYYGNEQETETEQETNDSFADTDTDTDTEEMRSDNTTAQGAESAQGPTPERIRQVQNVAAQNYGRLDMHDDLAEEIATLIDAHACSWEGTAGALRWCKQNKITKGSSIVSACMRFGEDNGNGRRSTGPPGGRVPENQAFLDQLLAGTGGDDGDEARY